MNFKDILENDIQNTFLNPKEFGETHNLNGVDVICVTDEDSFQEKEISGKLTIESGFYKEGITVFIDKKYLKYKPEGNMRIDFDNKEWIVANCKENFGIYELDLYRYTDY